MKRLLQGARDLGPYLLVELLLPGGTVIALLLWIFRNQRQVMTLLDARFNYIPAVATEVAATWKRFGFDPRANQEHRARLKLRT
jgi:hypothetical protein